MIVVLLSLLSSYANAQDADEDGCVDSYYEANGACVAPSASIGPDVAVASGAVIGHRVTLVGRVSASGVRDVGINTFIGRSTYIGADHDIGADNTIGRSVQVGERLQTEASATVGFGSDLGDDVFMGNGALVGALVEVGDNTRLETNAVVARGTVIADSGSPASIAGIIGPDVTIGSGFNMATGTRIRKDATVGNNVTMLGGARVGRDAIVGDDVTLGVNVRIAAGAEVTATSVVPEGTTVRRGEVFDNPSVGQFAGGTLLSPSEMVQINTWVGDPSASWSLCYKRSVDGTSAAAFHSGCDAYAGTIVVGQTSNRKFGAYTPITWSGNGSYTGEPTNSSFLFSLDNNFKHALLPGREHLAIVAPASYGPTFGGGHDILFFRDGGNPYCNMGNTYQCRVGSGATCYNDLCGTYNPSFVDIEVYGRD